MAGEALYYAMGGGLGHLTRARAVLAALDEKARVLSVSPHAADPHVTAGLDLLSAPSDVARSADAFGLWFGELLHEIEPRILYMDCFPAGLFGELCRVDLPRGLEVRHIARRLRWDRYRPLIQDGALRLSRVYRIEPLTDDHLAWLHSHSDQVTQLELSPDGAVPPITPEIRETLASLSAPSWLVVHSGPWSEVKTLLDYGREMAAAEQEKPTFIVVTQSYPAAKAQDVLHLPIYPARPLYPLVDRIISACGFNTMHETSAFREKHRFLPMPRRFDDQYARAARFRTNHRISIGWAG